MYARLAGAAHQLSRRCLLLIRVHLTDLGVRLRRPRHARLPRTACVVIEALCCTVQTERHVRVC